MIRQAIGTLLQARKLISPQDLDKALNFQRQFGGRVGSILVRMGALSEDALLSALSEQLGLSLVAGEALPSRADIVHAAQLGGLTLDWLVSQELVLWEGPDGAIHCASRNPIGSDTQETVEASFPAQPPRWHLIAAQDLERLLKLLLLQAGDGFHDDEIAHLRELAEEAPVIELVSNILAQAVDERASDIHIEPEERFFQVRYRIDGVLHTRQTLPRERFDAVASRVKLISALDIAERRLPQDGRISVRAGGAEMDIRVSVIPGVHGESIVMRLLPKQRADLRLELLGMEADHLASFQRWAKEAHGIVLVTGPTGSGKSTTLYSALEVANDRRHKIITVEDPVEYRMAGVTQIQVHSDIGYSFSRALRAILRHDPDIIMIGEIRDVETAEIAVQSALTGHMVFSTLHTNSAIAAFNRLLDMGVEAFLVASSVRAVEAQRLVRKLCPHCARPAPPAPSVREMAEELRGRFPALFAPEPAWREAAGCPQCKGTGYQGRLGIYEFVEVTPDLQTAVMRRASAAEMTQIAKTHGFRSLREDGLVKAWRGLTSIDEILRVTGQGEAED
jgi:general secretion pathway protein E